MLATPEALAALGLQRRFIVSLIAPHVEPVGHSLLFAVGAGPPQDGVRRTRCLNLSRDLEVSRPSGSGLSTRSPRPSSPRERRGIRPRQAETGTSMVMWRPSQALRPACPSGTRCRRPTCGAGLPPTCEPRRRGHAPYLGVWRCSFPRSARPTIWCCGSAENAPPHTAPFGPTRRRRPCPRPWCSSCG